MPEGFVRLNQSCLVFTEKSVLPENNFEAMRHDTLNDNFQPKLLIEYKKIHIVKL